MYIYIYTHTRNFIRERGVICVCVYYIYNICVYTYMLAPPDVPMFFWLAVWRPLDM